MQGKWTPIGPSEQGAPKTIGATHDRKLGHFGFATFVHSEGWIEVKQAEGSASVMNAKAEKRRESSCFFYFEVNKITAIRSGHAVTNAKPNRRTMN